MKAFRKITLFSPSSNVLYYLWCNMVEYLLSTLYGSAGVLYLCLFIMYSCTTSPDSIMLSFISEMKICCDHPLPLGDIIQQYINSSVETPYKEL